MRAVRKIAIFLFLVLSLFNKTSGQNIHKTNKSIQLDGLANESFWQNATIFSNFKQNFPTDSLSATLKTEVKLAFNEKNLFVFATCYHPKGQEPFVQTLKRDFNIMDNDVFSISFDPFGDGQNGFIFGVNALGAQTEAMIANGTSTTIVWDNRWFSEVQLFEDRWQAEFSIPFKSIRYNAENQEWNFNFMRRSLQENERSTWGPIPINFEPPNLAFNSPITFNEPLPDAGSNISIIPSVTTNISKDFQNQKDVQTKVVPSVDGKIAITPSLNLDLTLNPDFSQAEVDVQQTNLTRFELFFPERRQFFIENSDLFETFGFRQIRPFFSRRIGLNNGRTVPIIGGARLSGKLNNNWRIGLMNMQTEGNPNQGIDAQNYAVAAFQRKIFARSNIAGIFVNRQKFGTTGLSPNDYNRIAGLDYNIASKDNKWRGKLFHHHSFQPNNPHRSFANASWLAYNNRNWFVMWNHEYVAKNYQADVGFVRRNRMYNPITNDFMQLTYLRLEPMVRYNFFPKKGIINRHGPEIYMDYYTDVNLNPTDNLVRFSYLATFNNTSTLSVRYGEVFTKLFFPTDVSFTDKVQIPAGNYRYNTYGLNYRTDFRKDIQAFVSLFSGDYYTGKRYSLNSSLTYRLKPYAIFSLNYERNQINLPEFTSPAILNLFGFQADVSFSTSVFFNTFLQYNSQINNLNINTRLQWRFKPMSDLYLVYSENYDPHLAIKNRALVLKFIYWLTL